MLLPQGVAIAISIFLCSCISVLPSLESLLIDMKLVLCIQVKGRILTDQLSRLQEAFYGTWHALDEGLESSDPALAGALWRCAELH